MIRPLRFFFIYILLQFSLFTTCAVAEWILPQTGQTTCYDSVGTSLSSCAGTGQDGNTLAGKPWPTPRFTINMQANGTTPNGTVTDNLTGLIWLKNANCYSTIQTWAGALISASALASGTCGLADGSTKGQWRIPSVIELESLLNEQETFSSPWLNAQGFINVQPDYYWTSSTCAHATPSAWRITLYTGFVNGFDKMQGAFVWPVRSGN